MNTGDTWRERILQGLLEFCMWGIAIALMLFTLSLIGSPVWLWWYWWTHRN